MQLKKLVVAGCAALALCAANAENSTDDGVTLTVDRVQQRYPWNGLVDIDYTVTYAPGVSAGLDSNIEVLMIDRAVTPAVTNRALIFLQAPLPTTAGQHRITWDANADGVTNRTDQAEVRMSLVRYSEAYMVIDVSKGPDETEYHVDFFNGAPPNGFNTDEYKGDKIVLRRICPGSYVAGSPTKEAYRKDNEKQHRVAISQPFYIGIFEITQKQYENVMGADKNNSTHTGPSRPVEMMPYEAIRGTADTSNHTYDWPWNATVVPNSFMGLLRAKCKSKDSSGNYTVSVDGFDLPTEFQWEYACRAGTTGALNTTNAYDNTDPIAQETQLKLLGRYKDNQNDGKCSYVEHAVVGSYRPNQWGLYDMHGNVWEWCLDWYREDASALKQFTDPKGATAGSYRVLRGGGWSASASNCRSAVRLNVVPSSDGAAHNIGFRLSRSLP